MSTGFESTRSEIRLTSDIPTILVTPVSIRIVGIKGILTAATFPCSHELHKNRDRYNRLAKCMSNFQLLVNYCEHASGTLSNGFAFAQLSELPMGNADSIRILAEQRELPGI